LVELLVPDAVMEDAVGHRLNLWPSVADGVEVVDPLDADAPLLLLSAGLVLRRRRRLEPALELRDPAHDA